MGKVVFQPARHLLHKKIAKYKKYIKGKVLDVGAGSYQRYSGLFNYKEYITLDVDVKNKPDIVASADKIPLKDNSVDSVISTQMLGDVVYPQKVINEIHRVLKPGGYVLLTEDFLGGELDIYETDYWRFTDNALKRLFKKADFKIIKTEATSGFFATIAQQKIRYIINRLNLYQKPWRRCLDPFIRIYSCFMIWLDKIDKSSANKRVTIDWLILARKKK